MKLVISYGKSGVEYTVDGVKKTKKQVDKLFPDKFSQLVSDHKAPDGHRPSCWPMKCDATGGNPEQIPEAIAAAAKAGVKIDFDRKTGEAIYESRAQRKAYCQFMGFYDRSGTWGDA